MLPIYFMALKLCYAKLGNYKLRYVIRLLNRIHTLYHFLPN